MQGGAPVTRWVAEAREPDGKWLQVAEGESARQVIRQLRAWRAKAGREHLRPETRVRVP